MNRCAKAGVLDRLFEDLRHQQLVRVKIRAYAGKTPSQAKTNNCKTGARGP
jgi:hypothetical protein